MEMEFINLIDKSLLPKAYTNILFNDKMLKVFPLDLKQGNGSFHHHFFSVKVTDSMVSKKIIIELVRKEKKLLLLIDYMIIDINNLIEPQINYENK